MPRTTKKTTAPIEKHTIPTVPAAEQPYQVPENWRWVRLGEIYVINPPVEGDDSMDVSFVPMEKVNPGMCSDFTFDILPWKQAKKGHTRFANGDIAFAKISPCFENRKAFIATGLLNGIGGGTTELIILRHPKILKKYTYYSIMADRFINGGVQTYSGTVGQQRISMDYVRNYPFPLPPLAEQQRIVDRIESLFAKLDEAREKAQAVVDGFENRKAAILHKAFTGELTRKWREKRGIGIESWEFYKYSELGNSKLGKMLDKAKNDGQPIRYLRNVNVRWFDFDLTDVYTMLATDEEVNNLEVRDGDMFICEGGEPGRCAIWHGDCQRMIFQKALHRFRPNNKVISDYLCYYLYYLSHNGSLEKYYTGTTIKHLTGKALAEIEVFVPDITEQRIIIKSITNIFAQERRARGLAESVIAQIDGMKKAILARAFRGELGTNDPSEAACEG